MDDALPDLVDDARFMRDRHDDFWWSPAGRRAIKQSYTGCELRDAYAIAGRRIVDVPLPI